MIAIGYAICSSVFCAFLVNEREKKLRYLLSIMGCQRLTYWVGNFLFDLTMFSLTIIFLFILPLFFGVQLIYEMWLTHICLHFTLSGFWTINDFFFLCNRIHFQKGQYCLQDIPDYLLSNHFSFAVVPLRVRKLATVILLRAEG